MSNRLNQRKLLISALIDQINWMVNGLNKIRSCKGWVDGLNKIKLIFKL